MQTLGQLLLILTLLTTLATAATAAFGAITKRPTWMRGARHGLFAVALLAIAMSIVLTYGFLTDDYSSKYITQYSERAMPFLYKLAAFWGGERGALLFWVASLSIFANIAVSSRQKDRAADYMAWVTALLSLAILFFLVLMVFQSSPFDTWVAQTAPDDGHGLNPLLQNPVMALHPPALLTGYILFTIPFAFGMAALITNRLDDQWIADGRRWTIVSWCFLTMGLILGARWAYMEIGWGFWWMWDAVENAGLVPWFTATAFLHSVMIQERRGMLKRWNMVLLATTFFLTIVGTWMTRSQIIVSIHAFADSELSDYFLVYMAVILAASVALIGLRWRALRSTAHIESFMSREAMFVLNNVVLVFCAAVTLYGTLMGKITESESVRSVLDLDQPIVWDEAKFNEIFVPIGLVFLAILAIGPLISWRKATWRNFQKNFLWPIAWGSAVTLAGAVLFLVLGARAQAHIHQVDFAGGYALWAATLDSGAWLSIIVYWMSAIVLFSIAREFHVAARVKRKQHGGGYFGNILLVLFKNPRRYGGYTVHIGVVFLFFAFTGKAFKHEEKDRHMAVTDTHIVDRYAITMVDRNQRYSIEDGCVVADASFVVMPLSSTPSEATVSRVEAWLAARTSGPTFVKTTRNTPFVEVRVQDPLARAQVLGDFFLARRFAPHFERVDAGQTPRTEIWVPRDRKLLESMPLYSMDHLRAAREGLLASGLHVDASLQPGSPELTLRFPDEATQTHFHERLTQATVPDWLLTLVDDPETGALAIVDRHTGQRLLPESRFYPSKSTSTTEVAITGNDFLVDVYLSMQPDMGRPTVKLFTVVFPLVNFLWIGGLLMFLGSIICLTPRWVGRTISSMVSGSGLRDADPEEPAAEPAPTRAPKGKPIGEALARGLPLLLTAALGAWILFALSGHARAHAGTFDAPEPTGFAPPSGDPAADFLQTLDCACPLAPGETRPVPLASPACACPEAAQDRAVATDILSQMAPNDRASGRAKYLAYDQLIAINSTWETRIRYNPDTFAHLLRSIRTTCAGEYLMTLDATRATCSHRMRWAHDFRLLLAAGVSEDDIFAYYLADNNATQPGGPWEAHVLRTSDEQTVSYWTPLIAAILVFLAVGLLLLRNHRRALRRGDALAVVAPSAAPPTFSARERLRLDDELEAFDG